MKLTQVAINWILVVLLVAVGVVGYFFPQQALSGFQTTGITNFGGLALDETLAVTGATTLGSTLGVTGATTLGSTLGVTGATTLSSTLGVTGASTLTGAVAANGGLTVDSTAFIVADTSGNVTTAGTLTAGDKATFSGETVWAQSWITPTSGSSLTIAASYYVVNTTGAITLTLATTGATAGQIVTLYGDDNNNVTINDTNLLSSDGNAIVLGQYDIVILLFNGTKWVELSKTANS
jgi:hypothetical protein